MKKNHLILLGLLLVAAGLIYSQRPEPDVVADLPAPTPSTQVRNDDPVKPPGTNADSEDDAAIAGTIAQWQEDSGYYMNFGGLPEGFAGEVEIVHPYQPYDNETLRDLSEQGDMTATVMLADRILRSVDREVQNEGMGLHVEAATLGSTYSTVKLGSMYLHFAAKDGDDAKRIDGLAWYQVAISRGDPAGKSSYTLATDGSTLDQSVLDNICARAAQFRAELERTRRGRNLPDFDDTPPPMEDGMEETGLFSPDLDCFNG